MSVENMVKRGDGVTTAPTLLPLAMTVWVCAASPVRADTIRFKADLTGGSEAPPNDSKGEGRCDATLETNSNVLSWACTYSGVSGPLTGAHFDGPVSYSGQTTDEKAPIQVGPAATFRVHSRERPGLMLTKRRI